MWCLLLDTSNYFDERETKSTSSAGGRELNDHTCTLVHRDVTDDIDATLALCHLHNSTPKGGGPVKVFD
jgi:hypothetical protein